MAQNDFFQQLIVNAAATALDHRKMIVQRGLDLGGSLTLFREVLLTHKLMEMKIPHCDETVQESLLQVVGRLGERIAFRRAITMTIDDNSVIGSYTHGPFTFNVNGCVMGKYAALVVVRPKDLNGKSEQLPSLATRLTQHIVGMNPKFISLDNANHTNEMDKSDVLLEQQYLMDDSITVKELLQRNNAFVVDFLRLECGNE